MKKIVTILSIVLLAVFVTGCGKIDESTQEEQGSQQEQSQKIEELKNDPSLVWYEVPELGIRFKVTSDTREDLTHSFDQKSKAAYFSSQKETEKNKKLMEENPGTEVGWNRGWFFIKDKALSLKEMGNDACEKPQSHSLDLAGSLSFCLFRLESKVLTDEEYEEFFHVAEVDKNKNFGAYLNTIEKIK
jgi:hypothetical protein